MSEEQFNSDFKCTFACEFDPKTQKGVNHQFDRSRFEEIEAGQDTDFLFKMACKSKINELKQQNSSAKYKD